MVRIICLLIGYAFGLFQTSYIYGRTKGIDIREHLSLIHISEPTRRS